VRAVPRFCIIFYPGIYLTTEEDHGKPQSGHPKGARFISAERDSFSRLGHRLAMTSTGLRARVVRRGKPSVRVSICRRVSAE
jgi:hypothetical protein